ncbi:phosphatase PAP2 family protein [Vibrio mangrovi]|uniref:PAP2 superfamily protein n=1 Tax=Vibrio mangrovi TaxID=474394 RepID=A0A1Y6IT18_9VIBR|nr:phosphatase PAP2 family protein [Vibrio mangrovi]MDW6003981.1 phosphatase PAP2 family protein [Vibrio mangrovi]SMR99223.1 PAP2 superfamily protein [Vibrio mangrovi]
MCKSFYLAGDFVGKRFVTNDFIINDFLHHNFFTRHTNFSKYTERAQKAVNRKGRYTILAAGIILSLLNLPQANAGDDLTRAGDYLHVGIPITAGIISITKGDTQGLAQLVEGAIWTSVATTVLKETVKEERPNGENDRSFPSAHVSAAMQGSVYLHLRYGLDYAAPAYAATAVVAYSRVDGEYHYWHDVIASMILAGGIQYSISEMGYGISNLSLLPVISEDYYGFNLSFSF